MPINHSNLSIVNNKLVSDWYVDFLYYDSFDDLSPVVNFYHKNHNNTFDPSSKENDSYTTKCEMYFNKTMEKNLMID